MDAQQSEALVETLIAALDRVIEKSLALHNEMPLLGISFSSHCMDHVFCNTYLEPHVTFDNRGNAYFHGHLIVWRLHQKHRAVVFAR